jgi:hypothetical protein
MDTAASTSAQGRGVAPSPASPSRLDARRLLAVGAVGVGFWFLAAMAVRAGAPAGLFEGAAAPAVFALAVPGLWAAVWITRRAARLGRAQLVEGVAVATAAALVCDGVALRWAPWIYGSADGSGLLPGAAWILWGAGVGILIAVAEARRGG